MTTTLLMILVVAAASGLVGSFALMRRMALASDAISHVALPGLGLAILADLNPLIGGGAALLIGTLLIWSIENKTRIPTETIIGVVFSASLAIGSLVTPAEDLLESLFGEFANPPLSELIVGMLIALFIIAFILSFKEKLTLAILSPDLATTSGLKVKVLNLLFLSIFALNVILGLRFLGVLLMGSLIIIPAAIARNLARSLNSDLLISALVAMASVSLGFFISQKFNLALGPAIISAASFIFFSTLFLKR